MNTLVITIGLPQSGKSTWAKEQGLPIVSPDSIRLALHGKPYIGLSEPFVWAVAKVMVRALFLSGNEEVILDATNMTRKRRNEWQSKIWKRRYQFFPTREFVTAHETIENCKQRAATTCVDDEHLEGLIKAIDRMANEYEVVQDDEWDL